MTTGETPVIDSVRLATTAVGWNSWSRCGKGAPRLRGSPKEIEKVEFKTILDTSLHDFTRIIRFLFCFWGGCFSKILHILGMIHELGQEDDSLVPTAPAAGGLSLGGPCSVEGTGFGWDEQIRFFAKLRDWLAIFWEPWNNGDFSKDGDFTIKDREFINILLGCAPRHVAQLSKGLCHCCICIASCKSTAKDLTRTLTSPHPSPDPNPSNVINVVCRKRAR